MNRKQRLQFAVEADLLLDKGINIWEDKAPEGYYFAKKTAGGNWAVLSQGEIDYIDSTLTTLLREAGTNEIDFVDSWEQEWQIIVNPYNNLKVLTHYELNASIADAKQAGACNTGIIDFVKKILPNLSEKIEILLEKEDFYNFEILPFYREKFKVIVPKEDLTHNGIIENFCEPIYS